MFPSIHNSRPAAESLLNLPALPSTLSSSAAFEQQLYEALAHSLERLSGQSRQIQVNIQETTSQLPATVTGSRQYTITVVPLSGPSVPESSPASAEPELERLPPIRSNNGSVRDLENPIPRLTGLLQSMGVDTTGFRFDLIDEVISNWGGDYTNHYIRTRFPNGREQDFSVEWTLRNPRVTAAEIASLMKLPPPTPAV